MRKSILLAVLFGTALSMSSTMAMAAAKKADPAAAANRNTAHLVHDAVNPYCATRGKCNRHHRHHHWGWGHHRGDWGWGWHHRRHHGDWGWPGWDHHRHGGWGWWGWHDEHHHGHHHGRHHRHHKKAM